MKIHSRFAMVAMVLAGQSALTSARAQKADSLTSIKSEGAVVASSAADTATKKKGGIFGKLKSVAHNKTFQSVTKAALCTAVPGGQYMMAAADAKKSGKSIASGVANAQGCIPGMPGTGIGGIGGMGGLGGKAAIAGVAANAAGSLAGGGGTTAKSSAVTSPGITGNQKVPPSAAGTSTAQGLAGMQTAMAQANAASATSAGTVELSTEAAGEQMKLSGPVPDEIRKGKLVIKKIDWVHGSASVSASTTEGFMEMMMSAAQAMKSTGAKYRVNVYTDKKYADGEIALIGQQRAAVLVSLLQAGGQLTPDGVVAGKLGKDKEQRVEIVKTK